MKTFVFTDLAGSTALKSRMPGRNDNERARSFVDRILKPHLERLEARLSECHGQRVKNIGDGHLFVFDDVTQAARWAVSVQQKHHDEISSFRVDVKIGIHVGNPVPHPEDPNDFIGKPLDYAARLTDHATGGQILVSRQVMTLIVGEDVDDVRFHDHGERYLAGIGDRLVFELLYGEKTPQDTKSRVAPPEAEKDNFPTDDLAGFLKVAGSVDQEIPTSSQAAGGSDVKLAAADALAGSSLSLIGQRLGQYELLEMLGSGGMGDVYLAKHIGMERRCAIKVIKKDLLQTGHAELVDRFYREIKAAGDLKHPNIVVAYDSSTPHDDIHYLVMEYVEGISLDKLIQRTGPLRVENACELIRQAAAGLQSLHDRKMVHRDIKPSNLILAMDGSRAVVKILDLGLALLVDETEDRLTEFQDKPIGTGMFMAPEQWENTSVDIRADIYSLGCTMYHLLVGHPPFKHSHLKQKHAHQTERVPLIRRDTPIPKQVWAVQQKMLAKRPEDRFATPQEVADALTDLGDDSDLERLFQVSVRSSVTIDAPDVHRHDTYSAGHSDWETETARNTTRLGTPPPPETGWRGAVEWATRPWAAATVLLALLAAFIGVPLAYQLFADRPPGSQLSPAVRQEAINFLTTLPGLNGRWWYYEVPWYCPRARLVLLSSLTDSDYEKLKRLAAAANESGFYMELKRLTDAAIADESIKPALETEAAAAQFRDIYRMLVQLQPDPLKRSKTDDADADSGTMRERELVQRATTLAGLTNHPADQHLLAILQWRRMEAVAKDTFEHAQTGYDALPKNVAPSLEARCLADHATTLILSRRTYEVAADYCRRARGRLGDPGANYFRLYALTTEAEAYQKQSKPETLADMEATLQEAANLAIASLNAQHPLRAFLHERTSVMRLETWQLYAAGSEAIQAEGIRSARLNASGRDRFAKHARYQMLRDKQIAALAHHFKGAVDSALQTYQELLTQVVEAGNNPQLESAERSVLMAMQPNLYGRKADCYFYQAADFAAALADIDQAKQSALEVGFPNDDRIVHLVRICYRASMTASLTGNAQAAQAYRDEAKRYDANMASMFQTKVAAQRRRNALFQQVADALLLTDGDRTTKLVQVVENNVVDFAKLTRDDRQLLLFVCQFVIEHGQLDPELRDRIDKRMDYLLAPLEAANQTYADEYSSNLTKSVRAWSAQGAAIGQPRLEAANLDDAPAVDGAVGQPRQPPTAGGATKAASAAKSGRGMMDMVSDAAERVKQRPRTREVG